MSRCAPSARQNRATRPTGATGTPSSTAPTAARASPSSPRCPTTAPTRRWPASVCARTVRASTTIPPTAGSMRNRSAARTAVRHCATGPATASHRASPRCTGQSAAAQRRHSRRQGHRRLPPGLRRRQRGRGRRVAPPEAPRRQAVRGHGARSGHRARRRGHRRRLGATAFRYAAAHRADAAAQCRTRRRLDRATQSRSRGDAGLRPAARAAVRTARRRTGPVGPGDDIGQSRRRTHLLLRRRCAETSLRTSPTDG